MQDSALPPLPRPAYGPTAPTADRRLRAVPTTVPTTVPTADAPPTRPAAADAEPTSVATPAWAAELPASRRRRLAARLVDVACCAMVVGVAQAALWTALTEVDPRLAEHGRPLYQAVASWAWLAVLLTVLVWLFYEVPLTTLRGQTPGKMAVHIRVVTEDPRTLLTWHAALARWALLGLPSIFGVFGAVVQLLDCAWLLRRSPQPQCLHDRLAHTHVITMTRPRR